MRSNIMPVMFSSQQVAGQLENAFYAGAFSASKSKLRHY